MSRETPDISDLTELLTDAQAAGAVWNPERRRLTMTFNCLRSGVDGSALADRSVELPLSGVCAVAVAARVDWLIGDLDRLIAAPHRLSLHAHAGHPGVERWITIAFDDVTPLAGGAPLDWAEWADHADPERFELVYARAVDSWWIEGRRAGVRMLGISHLPELDGEPPRSLDPSLAQRPADIALTP